MKPVKSSLASLFHTIGDLIESGDAPVRDVGARVDVSAADSKAIEDAVRRTRALTAPMASAAPKAKAARGSKAPKATKAPRTKDTTNVDGLVGQFVSLIGAAGMRSEEARKQLGVSRQTFDAVATTARERALVRKEGERRGTTYFRVGAELPAGFETSRGRRSGKHTVNGVAVA